MLSNILVRVRLGKFKVKMCLIIVEMYEVLRTNQFSATLSNKIERPINTKNLTYHFIKLDKF